MTNHSIFLGMFKFHIKKKYKSDNELISVDDFLTETYFQETNKFEDGFAKDVFEIIGTDVVKTPTHGGKINDGKVDTDNHYIDIMLDGGLTGIQQFLIDNKGNKKTISAEDIVGLRFFGRIWLPKGGHNFYVFLTKYSDLSLKRIFEYILIKVLEKHELQLIDRSIKATTTRKRFEEFMKSAYVKQLSLISKTSTTDTSIGDATQAELVMKFPKKANLKSKFIDLDFAKKHAKKQGFELGDRNYEMKAVYGYNDGTTKEEKTAQLDTSEDTINIIPNVRIINDCIDNNNYPIFEKMRTFVSDEIEIVKQEAKM